MTAPTVPVIGPKMGPGLFTIGATGSAVDATGLVQSAQVGWKADSDDDIVVLSGATIAGDRTYTATVKLTILQDDLADSGLIAFSWTHKGTQVPFTFTPTNGGKSIAGELTLDPIDVGGDVKKRNTADITWDCVGEPALIDDLG